MKLKARFIKNFMLFALIPVLIEGIAVSVEVNTSGSSISATTSKLIFATTIIIILATVVLAAIMSFIAARLISVPIINVSKTMDKISEGDFTIEITNKGKDEFGHLSSKLNSTIQSVRNSIAVVKNTAIESENASTILVETAQDVVNTIDSVYSTLEVVSNDAVTQSEQLEDAVSLLAEFKKGLEASNIKLDEANKAIKDTETIANDGNSQIDSLVKTICDLKEAFDTVINKINNLDNAVSKIGNITDVINEISEQTNLLALNAAIEAARAGEQGKGFAVVAEEVGKLAAESKESSEKIIDLVKTIGSETKEVMSTSQNVGKFLDNQAEAANNTITVIYDIVGGVNGVVSLMDETNNSIKIVNETIDKVSDKIQNAAVVSENASKASLEMSAATKQMLESSEKVTNNTELVSNSIKRLSDEVGKFTV